MRSHSRFRISNWPVVAAVFAITLLPLLLYQLGFGFEASAYSSGWASGKTRLQFDVVTLALVMFLAIGVWMHQRIEARRGVLILGVGFLLAGLANGLLLVPDNDAGALRAIFAGRAAGAAILAIALITTGFAGRLNRGILVAALAVVGAPVVVGTWIAPVILESRVAPVSANHLGVISLMMMGLCALMLLRFIRRGRLRYFGRGLLLGLVPMIAGQCALLFHLAGHAADGPAMASLFQWFAWTLPCLGLAIDALLAIQDRNLIIEKRFLRAVVDAIPHFIYARDDEGRYTLANNAVARFFGRRAGEIEGRLLTEVHEGETCQAWLDEDKETLRRGEQWSFPERLVDTEGREVHVHSIKRPLETSGPSCNQVLGVSIDVTDRLRAERALSERLELERATGAIQTAFVQCTADGMDAALEDVLAHICAFSGADRAYVYRVGEDGGPIERMWHRAVPAANQIPAPPERLEAVDLHWAANWLAVAAPVDVGGDLDWPEGSEDFRFRFRLSTSDAMLAVPIVAHGKLFGLIGIDRCSARGWRRDTMTLVRSVANLFITVWEKQKAERDLMGAMEAAQASSRAKTEFLANMSHEIRTPMNCIIGIADLLSEMEPTVEQGQYLEMVRQAGASLLTVLNDILDISKIESGRMELNPTRTDLRAVIEEVVGMIAFTAQSRGLEVVCRLAPGLPVRGVLDGGRLRQVLTNLLNNAAKFTRRGHIYLDAEPVGQEGNATQVRFRIVDTGIGITDDQMEHIFDNFTQADAGMTRRYGGTGLGLAICRRLVDLMGGELQVESVPEQGSTFSFTVSIARPEALVLEPVGRNGENVLIISGQELAGEVVAEQVRQLGCTANLAMTAPDALTMLAGNPTSGDGRWCAVLVDQSLPVKELEAVAAHCRGLAPSKRPRLWLMTDLAARPHDVVEGLDGFLTKPVRLDRLAAVLDAPPMDRVLAMPRAITVTNVDHDDADVDAGGARILLVEDNPFNQQVATALLGRLGCQVEVANNGREAVEMVPEGGYDLVFMDCQMPEMDGYEATRRIRGMDAPIGTISIVAMTANALSGDRDACFASGMDDFVSKPITKAMLGAILKRVGVVRNPVCASDC